MKKNKVKIPKVDTLPSGSKRIRGTIAGKLRTFIRATEEECISAYLLAKTNEELIEDEEKPTGKTLEQAMDEYITFREKSKSPSTIRGYNIIRNNAFPNLMPKQLAKITRNEWQSAIDDDIVAGKSGKTIKNRFDLVKAILKENNLPIPKLSMPSPARSKDDTEDFIRFLDDKELETFCAAIKDSKYELMCYLALNSLRASELYGMTWDKIDLKNKKLIVQGAVVPDSNNQMVRKQANKNATSTRTIPILFPRIIELVEEADTSEPIASVTVNWFYKWVNKTCADNSLPEVGIHGLRHTGASLCVYRGVKKKAIMHWFGWSVPDTLEKIYSHISERQRDLEAEKVIEVTSKMS